MLQAKRILEEIVRALREVIAPAIEDPYPKSQAYMAAVILEFVARQVEERGDIGVAKEQALTALFQDLTDTMKPAKPSDSDGGSEAQLCRLIETLWNKRPVLGEPLFLEAHQRVRRTLRELLDQDLKVATKAGD
jgi:hypothetical protein